MNGLIAAIRSSSLLRFGLTGLLNTAVGLGIIYALKWFFAVADTAANFCGYAVGICVSYYVNSRWTFRYRQALQAKLLPYALVLMVAYLANLACVQLCLQVLNLNSYAAQAVGIIPYSLLTYLLLRRYVFATAVATDATPGQ